jgi:hypothetical protein
MSGWMNKKMILLICRDFPPYGGSAGTTRRMESMFSFLQENGFHVHVLASRGYQNSNKKEHAGAFYINDFIHKRIGRAKHGFDNKKNRFVAKVLRAFFKNMLGELLVPDYSVLMCYRYFRLAKKLINEEKIEVIVTSGPVHSIHLVGLLLKRLCKGKLFWIVDYRDSWNCSFLFRKKILFQILSRLASKEGF